MKFEGLVEGLHSTRTRRRMRRKEIVSSAMSHVHKGFGVVRPSLHGPADLPEFLQRRSTRSQSRHPQWRIVLPEHAEHRPYVLGLCHHGAAYCAHNRQPTTK